MGKGAWLGATLAAILGASEADASNLGEAAASTASQDVDAKSVESEAATSDEGWQVAVIPYIWASGMKVDIATPQGDEVNIDQSFGDILGDLKFTFMGALDARRGRFVTVQDIVFLSMGTSVDGDIGPGLVDADVDFKILIVTPLAGYRVVDKGPLFLDIMAGARITSMEAGLQLTGPLQTVERESSKTKIGPVIASRFRLPFGENWGAAIYGDVGGFGVTSDFSWQLMGTIQYDVSDHWRMVAGWRHVAVRQDKGNFDIDLVMDGPFLGFAYRF